MTITNDDFQEWASSFSGCDGGDVGNKTHRSSWVCGIEWGGGHDPESLKASMKRELLTPPAGYESAAENLAYIFNRQTLKLLAAIQGEPVENYVEWNEKQRPFTVGSQGYFKMNLFPISFKDTGHQRWQEEFIDITGFPTKTEYLAWCKLVRFAEMRSWVDKFKPKVIVCFGKTYVGDFGRAFVNDTPIFVEETILDRKLSWIRTQDDVLVVVCPFPVNRYGLNSHKLLKAFGERIRQLLNHE